MKQVELIAMPVVPFPSWTIGSADVMIGNVQENLMAALTRYCPPFNITGMPAIAVPNGFNRAGLPLGFQIAGRLFDDATVLRVARAYERVTDLAYAAAAAAMTRLGLLSPRVGMIGLGAMGGAMADTLMQAGHRVSGFDVDQRALERFRAAGDPRNQMRRRLLPSSTSWS